MPFRFQPPFALLLAVLLLPAGLRPAGAGEGTAQARTEGARVTLRAAPADASGEIRAALAVELDPGWKTYWLDPGQSGIPPLVAAAPPHSLRALRLPEPHRFGEGFERATGFTGAPAFALTLAAEPGAGNRPVEVTATLGICREICVPLVATLRAAPQAASLPAVSAAFAALPPLDASGETIRDARLERAARRLLVTVASPDGAAGEIFVAGEGGWYFGEPGPPVLRDGLATYEVPVTGRPRGEAPAPMLTIVEARGGAARERRLRAVDPAVDRDVDSGR